MTTTYGTRLSEKESILFENLVRKHQTNSNQLIRKLILEALNNEYGGDASEEN